MKTKTIVEKEFTHSFSKGRIYAKIRDYKLVELGCYKPTYTYGLTGTELISFIMENWSEIKEIWEAIKAEITKS